MRILSYLLISLLPLTGLHAAASVPTDRPVAGAWDTLVPPARPRLDWESLKGYRLFFHPEDAEGLRHALTIAAPAQQRVLAAYALVRPLGLSATAAGDDAWMRVEGVPKAESVSIEWDGAYDGQPFPDGAYQFQVRLLLAPDERRSWDVVVYKSKDHPNFIKLGDQEIGKHSLGFRQGEFVPSEISASFSKAATPQVALLARVWAPMLEGAFAIEGAQMDYRQITDAKGKALESVAPWACLCQQALPGDSPARIKARKVRCDWDLAELPEGNYELRVSLYHLLKHPQATDPCDTPRLDQDRLRVVVRP